MTLQSETTPITDGAAEAHPGLRPIWGYLLAGGLAAAALAVRFAFDPLWGDRLPYAWFFMALLAISFLAKPGPQMLVLIAGLLLGNWFFVPPRHAFSLPTAEAWVNAILYLGIGLAIVLLSHRAQRARSRELAAHNRITGILECTSDAVCTLDSNWRVTYFNGRAAELTQMKPEQVLGRNFWEAWPNVIDTRFEAEYRTVMERRTAVHFEEYDQLSNRWIEVHAYPYESGIATFFRDVNNRKQADAERERLIAELRDAMAQVKTLSGLLPICSQCKKIRDDKGAWNQIEVYIRDRSNANFTHGICPECARHLYPSLYSQ